MIEFCIELRGKYGDFIGTSAANMEGKLLLFL